MVLHHAAAGSSRAASCTQFQPICHLQVVQERGGSALIKRLHSLAAAASPGIGCLCSSLCHRQSTLPYLCRHSPAACIHRLALFLCLEWALVELRMMLCLTRWSEGPETLAARLTTSAISGKGAQLAGDLACLLLTGCCKVCHLWDRPAQHEARKRSASPRHASAGCAMHCKAEDQGTISALLRSRWGPYLSHCRAAGAASHAPQSLSGHTQPLVVHPQPPCQPAVRLWKAVLGLPAGLSVLAALGALLLAGLLGVWKAWLGP